MRFTSSVQSEITPRNLIIIFAGLVILHIVLSFNKTYTVYYSPHTTAVQIGGVDNEQYKLFLNGFEQGSRAHVVSRTKLFYFDLIPYWLHYGFWLLYLALAMIFLKQIKPKDKPLRKAGEPLNEYASRMTEWMESNENTARQTAVNSVKDLMLEARIAIHGKKGNPPGQRT